MERKQNIKCTVSSDAQVNVPDVTLYEKQKDPVIIYDAKGKALQPMPTRIGFIKN